ncbi:MAG: hypothetical protein IKH34_05790, partial [Oscillospiraceae bacterium]|nr:hypothetical protein [Oscillospiraceae bacterium]
MIQERAVILCITSADNELYYSSIKTIDNPGAAGNAPNGIRRKITNRITEPENHFFQSREDLVAK